MKQNKKINNTFLRAAENVDGLMQLSTYKDVPLHTCIELDIILGWPDEDTKQTVFYRELLNISDGSHLHSNYTFEQMEAKATKKALSKVNVKKINERRVLALLFTHWAYNSENC